MKPDSIILEGINEFRKCSIDGCLHKMICRTWCNMHYARWFAHGDPLLSFGFKSLEERFWAKVDKSSGCWLWTAYRNTEGYGVFTRFGRSTNSEGAHRVSYIISSGAEIPNGMHVLHKCDNPSCVNPDHLYLGGNIENSRDRKERGRVKSILGDNNNIKTHCPAGHIYSGNNLYSPPGGGRKCRECNKMRSRLWRKNHKI